MTGFGFLLVFLALGFAAYSMLTSTHGLGQPDKDRNRDSRHIKLIWALIILGMLIANYG